METMNKFVCLGGIALLCASSAFAQSAVRVYGIVDSAVQVSNFDRSGAGTLHSVNSGHRNASRWGLRGSEDLGGGLKAIYQLEGGFFGDTGMLGQGGRLFGRQVYVGLDSDKYGTFAMGRIASFDGATFDMFVPIDPFFSGYGIASLASTFTNAGGLRVDNAILYRTPRFAGIQAGVIHSLQTNGAESAGSGNNTRFDNLGINYQSGPLYASLIYSKAKFPNSTGFKDQDTLYIGAAYDLKIAKVHGAYGIENGVRSALLSPVGANAEGTDAKSWMLGVTVPYGPLESKFRLGAQKRDGESTTIGTTAFDADRLVYGLAYEYFLSSRTIIHASAAKSKGSGTLQANRAATDFANQTQFTVGVTHIF